MTDADDRYSSEVATGNAAHRTLFALWWAVDELSRLFDDGLKLIVQCRTIGEQLACQGPTGNTTALNTLRQLTDLRTQCSQELLIQNVWLLVLAGHPIHPWIPG